MGFSEQDTKSTSRACSTNTPNLPFFFSPYVITHSRSQPGCRPTAPGVNSPTPPERWERSHRSAAPPAPPSSAR
ncbi:hypothetical protein CK936_23775 [Streptomyces albireticuli]|uniref:Uncharacterized protein n=1 Tax=Streptomyces albireticuli TaxID=1940 RepID=A0A2A2D4Z7_9ACTN|nr:hypothetical protein CK936_23775 [Streptomyces albireticuli]